MQDAILNPDAFRKSIVSFKLLSRQIGIACSAPAEVLIASAPTCAAPRDGMIMASTPAHSALLAMAPKFLTSVILQHPQHLDPNSFRVMILRPHLTLLMEQEMNRL